MAERASLIQQGRQYDAEIVGCYFDSKLKDCLNRNRQRTGKAKIPDVGLYATLKKLVQPDYAEGFHRLFHVAIGADGAFDVTACRQDVKEVFDRSSPPAGAMVHTAAQLGRGLE